MKELKKRSKSKQATRMPSIPSEIEGEMGLIHIHENVIASIVRKATCSVDGVIRLAGSTLVDGLAGIVGSRKMHDRAITVDIDEASVQIEVKVNLFYGVHVPDVATQIQTAVIDQVQKITGMNVTRVNVVVQELDDVEEEIVEEEDED